jgi:4-hydroxythreonine-4-phosphate dehydrogenase
LIPPLALTPGDPAGIGPDLVLALASHGTLPPVAIFGDPEVLHQRARELGLAVPLVAWQPGQALPEEGLAVHPIAFPEPVTAGRPDPANAPALLAALDTAVEAVQAGHCAALVTAPVSKSVIAEGTGRPFGGHTDYLAERCGAGEPTMMLAGGGLRVALVTTHIPLAAVPGAIGEGAVRRTAVTVHDSLRSAFGIPEPRLKVAGLNPHAGENGTLGREEADVILPALERARAERPGMHLEGPLPADTLFTPAQANGADAVIAMYHDQGLIPLKQAAFGRAVNVTLGLPLVRTSVDHGTAFELAGTGAADPASLHQALTLAADLASRPN